MTDNDFSTRLARLEGGVSYIRQAMDESKAETVKHRERSHDELGKIQRDVSDIKARVAVLESRGGSEAAEEVLEARKANRPDVAQIKSRQDVDDALQAASWRVMTLAVAFGGAAGALIVSVM